MTYEQALAILYRAYPNPLTVSGTERLRAMTSAGVPYEVASNINLKSYTAIRTGSTLESALTSAGYLTAATTPTQSTTALSPTSTTSIAVPDIFGTTPAPTTPTYYQPPTPTIYAPSTLASQESGAIGAASIASQMAAAQTTPTPTSTSTYNVPSFTNPLSSTAVTSTQPTYLTPQTTTAAPSGVPSFTAPTAVTTTAPATITYAPSPLASQESGAIGAASIASQIAAAQSAPTVSAPPLPSATSAVINPNLDAGFLATWNRSDIAKPTFFYDPVQKLVFVTQGDRVFTADQPITDAVNSGQLVINNGRITNTATGYSAGTGTWLTNDRVLSQLTSTAVGTYNAKQLQPPTTATTTTPPVTINPAEVPTVQNPITTPPPTGPAPTIQVPSIPATTSPTAVSPTMGGSLADQIAYMSAIRRATAGKAAAEVAAQQQRADIGKQYEPQIRKAGREMYNQQIKALAALGARGISGAPGLSVAARRAAMAAPAMQYTGLINERQRQLGALERTLATQLADYEETLRASNEQLTRATTLANQLTGTGQ
jgi:hypothetical protein